MATSSIFAKIRINDPKQAEAFIDALSAAENSPSKIISDTIQSQLTDYEAIRHLLSIGEHSDE